MLRRLRFGEQRACPIAIARIDRLLAQNRVLVARDAIRRNIKTQSHSRLGRSARG